MSCVLIPNVFWVTDSSAWSSILLKFSIEFFSSLYFSVLGLLFIYLFIYFFWMILLFLLNSFCSCIVFLILLNICLYILTIHWISLKGLFWVLWHLIDILYFLLAAQSVWFFATPWTVARQAPLSMEFSRQEYCSGLPFPSPGDLPHLEIKRQSPELQADYHLSHQGYSLL